VERVSQDLEDTLIEVRKYGLQILLENYCTDFNTTVKSIRIYEILKLAHVLV